MEVDDYSINGFDNEVFIRNLLLSPLISAKQIPEISSSLPTMSQSERIELFNLLQNSVESTIKLFRDLPKVTSYREHQTFKRISSKLKELTEIEGRKLNLTLLDDVAKTYSFQIGDLLSNIGYELITPEVIRDYLKRYVIGQDDSIQACSFNIYLHLLRIGFLGKDLDALLIPRQSILLMGKTGTGKSYMIKLLATLFCIPYSIVNSAALTSAGIIGESVDSGFTSLLLKSGGDANLAEKGILLFDEIDKISMTTNSNSVSSLEVQQEMLSVLDGNEINVFKTHSRYADKIALNSTKMLFVFAGAFSMIDKVISRRLGAGRIGFNSSSKPEINYYKEVTHEDLIQYGFMPEFAARFSKIVSLNPLSAEDIVNILTKTPNNAYSQYQNYFKFHNVDLEIDKKALEYIGQRVAEKQLGARFISNILDTLLNDLAFKAPSLNGKAIKIGLDEVILKLN